MEAQITEEEKKKLREHRDSLESNINALMNPGYPENIPALLDKVFTLIDEKGYYPNLSNFYPQNLTANGGEKLFEIAYILREDGIYLVAFDPSSDTVDSGNSHTKKITRGEFLEWIEKDSIRILDVYNHLVSYIESPAVQKEECQHDLCL